MQQNLLYHFLPDLESYQSHMRGDSKDTLRLKHLDLLIEYIKTTYKPTGERLLSLLRRKEITYDLLWALFKPGSEVYSTCEGTRVVRCVICDHGEEKVELNGSKYFLVEIYYLDFDGKTLGEATAKYKVPQFRGAIWIDLSDLFGLEWSGSELKSTPSS